VSLVLPVKNAGDRLRDLLPRIFQQRTDDQLEIIAVDSGSSDDTIDILRENACTVLEIDASSFNHGLTRNLGAGYAHGSVVVFMNQTALPADEWWLVNLLRPLDNDRAVAGVCSRVLPRHDADYLAYLDGTRDPSASNERAVREITNRRAFEALSHQQQRLFINFHTVSAAIRTPVLRQIPFRSVVIGEDIAWAKDVLEAGYRIQHEPSSVVFHGHPYSVLELFQRNVDDGLANHQLVGRSLRTDEIDPLSQHLIREDWKYLEQSRGLVGEELIEWKIEACRRRTAQVLGQWVGVQGGRWAQSVSLTERIKAGDGGSAHARTGSRKK
jgi:rhamnosyltransferase